MKARFFSALFILSFLTIACVMSCFYALVNASKNSGFSWERLIDGQWSVSFEKILGEALPIFNASRNFWGMTEFSLFHQGRKGVVVGEQGWLFTDEEFTCPRNYAGNLKDNLDFISKTRDMLAAQKTALTVVLIPAKSRVYSGYLGKTEIPSCRKNLYQDVRHDMDRQKIKMVDMLEPMLKAKNQTLLYLRTDTHWSPEGAQYTARQAAASISNEGLPRKKFNSAFGAKKDHGGDLLRYTPGVDSKIIKLDRISEVTTSQAGGNADLFGNETPEAVLVGTSYSANPLWNFDGFLKEYLATDLLNMADEGLGPFTVMDKYISGKTAKESPPKLLIWEIPERYMLLPHHINTAP